MCEFRQVTAYLVALLGLFAAGYAVAGWAVDPAYSLARWLDTRLEVSLPAAESAEPAVPSADAERSPVWIAPTPKYSYEPPAAAPRARQLAKEKGRRGGQRTSPQKITGQSRELPGQITIAPSAIPFERPMAETR